MAGEEVVEETTEEEVVEEKQGTPFFEFFETTVETAGETIADIFRPAAPAPSAAPAASSTKTGGIDPTILIVGAAGLIALVLLSKKK